MNVLSNQQALVLADASLAARVRNHPEANAASHLTIDGELRKRVTVLTSPPDSTVIVVRADYFTRTDAKERGFIADARYSNSRTPRQGEDRAEPSVVRQFTAREGVTSSKLNATALYARIQGAAADIVKGTHIDVFV